MIVFAAGNKYSAVEIKLVDGNYCILGRRMVKTTGKFTRNFDTYDVGPIEPVEVKEEEA